ncbi:hypothetical protein TIFTF001_026802 [Ficus carica]|uniref:Uncharacterized protein n=1 Tax=Ficus carica TaxID=3494 RepID=A0AA88DLT9_FICCA|nr:hypothetical protein TIFTF001_026802 [Ficus carica]
MISGSQICNPIDFVDNRLHLQKDPNSIDFELTKDHVKAILQQLQALTLSPHTPAPVLSSRRRIFSFAPDLEPPSRLRFRRPLKLRRDIIAPTSVSFAGCSGTPISSAARESDDLLPRIRSYRSGSTV